MITLTCQGCGTLFDRNISQHNSNIKRGRKIIACSNICVNKARTFHPNKVYQCLYCKQDFSRKKTSHDKMMFCKRQCASLNMKKNSKIKLCKYCSINNVIGKKISCDECKTIRSSKHRRQIFYEETTLEQLKEKYSTLAYHAKIRGISRQIYKASKGSMQCEACGYSLHVDICHIKDVKDFNMQSTLIEVNNINNLIALDKRCHWEFDHGYLSLNQIRNC